jgi:hypothetical protein
MKYITAMFLALLALVTPSAALADKPLRELLAPPSDFTLETCGFPVHVHVEGRVVSRTWFDDEGNPVRASETYPGGYRWVLTNLVTQGQLTVPVSGPVFAEFNPDGSVTVRGTGRWIWGRVYPELITGEPGLFFIRGHFTFTVDAEGNLSGFELIGGQVESLCDDLAAL